MKQLFRHTLYTALAVFSLVFTACSNDDIEIARTSKLTLTIGTQQLYDQLDLTSSIQNLLGNHSEYQIGVNVFVYDEQGTLVRKELITSRTFQTLSVELEKMDEGAYTVVAVETMLDADNGNNPIFWTFTGEDNLSTLRLDKIPSTYIYWYGAAAVSTEQIQLNGNDESRTITPTSIGYIISCGYENVGSLGLSFLALDIKNESQGLWLDPQHEGSTKLYYENYNQTNFWTDIAGFYDSNGIADSDNYDIFAIETGQQDYLFGLATPSDISDEAITFKYTFPEGGGSFTFLAGETYAGYLIYDPTDEYVYYYMDDIDGFNSWYESVTRLYEVPYLTWGGTVASVKSYMKDYKAGSNGNVLSNDDGTYTLWYYGAYKEDEIDYRFTTSTSGLNRVDVFFDSKTVGEDDILACFNKLGYTYVTTQSNGVARYRTSDGSTNVYMAQNSYGDWDVFYTKASASSRMLTAAPANTGGSVRHKSEGAPALVAGKNIQMLTQLHRLKKAENAFYSGR